MTLTLGQLVFWFCMTGGVTVFLMWYMVIYRPRKYRKDGKTWLDHKMDRDDRGDNVTPDHWPGND